MKITVPLKLLACVLCGIVLFSCSRKTERVSVTEINKIVASDADEQTENQKITVEEQKYTEDEQQLVHLLTQETSPFSNQKGEAFEMSQNILNNKKAFLIDLNEVLNADSHNLLLKADKQTKLAADYVPPNLVSLGTEKHYWVYRNDLSLRVPVEAALAKMAADAESQGIKLVVSSSYRSYDYQVKVYNRIVAELGQEAADRESARPGASQHQLGTAVDFGSITDAYAETEAGKWLAANAASYGWSLSFPKNYEEVTGYRWECWHFRYVGVPAVEFQEKWFKNIQQYMIEFIYSWRESK